jgi:hypothetical protein
MLALAACAMGLCADAHLLCQVARTSRFKGHGMGSYLGVSRIYYAAGCYEARIHVAYVAVSVVWPWAGWHDRALTASGRLPLRLALAAPLAA